MRLTRLVPLAAVLVAAAACGDLKEVMAFSAKLQAQYHVPAMVNVNNGRHVTITFQNASIASLKLDSAGRAGFARDVAVFTKSHYPDARRLEDIRVGFSSTSGAGPVTLTRTDAPYVFRAAELPGGETPDEARPAAAGDGARR